MTSWQPITTVYSYYLPEIRELITELTRDYPHEVFLRSISPGLDDFHHPIIEKLTAAHQHDVPHLARFSFQYPTSGSAEGIREYLTLLRSQGVERIYVWRGEYEGYREDAMTRNIATVEVDFDQDPSALAPGHWFLSNPSARDGMIVPRERILAVAEAGHQVFYDLAYLGSTAPTTFDVDHPNIAAVVLSFSKTFGLFYYRVGFTYCHQAIPSLTANKWFKNVFGLLVAEKILEEIDATELASKYKGLQADVVRRINQRFELGLTASDAFLIAKLTTTAAARLTAQQQELIRDFKRGDVYRFCLTPYFED